MSTAEEINQILVAANAAQLEGFDFTQKALLELVKILRGKLNSELISEKTA